jgi:hypothetical protein
MSKISEIERQMEILNDESGKRIKNNPRMMDAFKIAGIKIEGRYGDDDEIHKDDDLEINSQSKS